MINFKSIEYCKCDECVHNKICMYKQSLSNVVDKMMNKIEESSFSEEAPFILNIECQFKTESTPLPRAPFTNPKPVNQVLYQPNQTVSGVDAVAHDPMSVINTMYKEPVRPQVLPDNIKTIQNGVVTNSGKPQNKKLTTEEKVAMLKSYASNQYIPGGDNSVSQASTIPSSPTVTDSPTANEIPIQPSSDGTGEQTGTEE